MMPQDDSPLAIAFLLTGSLGDHIAGARFVRDLSKAAGPFVFDVYSSRPAAARWLFSTFANCRACYDEATSWDQNRHGYPLGLWVMQFVSIDRDCYDAPRIRAANSVLAEMAVAIDKAEANYELFIANTPRTDSLLARRAFFMGVGRNRISHTIAGLAYGGDEIDVGVLNGVLERFELDGKRYITVHNGFDVDYSFLPKDARAPSAERSTRAYPAFDKVIASLKSEFRDVEVVQLGGQSSVPIPRADVNLINRTSLGETAELLRGAVLHLDSEGGLVHLASAVGTRCAVVFGPTPVEYLAYKDNINLPPPVCGDCWWATEDWQTNCPKGMLKPQCLSERTPDSIVDAVRPALSASLAAAAGRRGLRERLGIMLGAPR
jgi:hypothetical protein